MKKCISIDKVCSKVLYSKLILLTYFSVILKLKKKDKNKLKHTLKALNAIFVN